MILYQANIRRINGILNHYKNTFIDDYRINGNEEHAYRMGMEKFEMHKDEIVATHQRRISQVKMVNFMIYENVNELPTNLPIFPLETLFMRKAIFTYTMTENGFYLPLLGLSFVYNKRQNQSIVSMVFPNIYYSNVFYHDSHTFKPKALYYDRYDSQMRGKLPNAAKITLVLLKKGKSVSEALAIAYPGKSAIMRINQFNRMLKNPIFIKELEGIEVKDELNDVGLTRKFLANQIMEMVKDKKSPSNRIKGIELALKLHAENDKIGAVKSSIAAPKLKNDDFA